MGFIQIPIILPWVNYSPFRIMRELVMKCDLQAPFTMSTNGVAVSLYPPTVQTRVQLPVGANIFAFESTLYSTVGM